MQAIENYGIIGNMRSSALVGIDGAIDFLTAILRSTRPRSSPRYSTKKRVAASASIP